MVTGELSPPGAAADAVPAAVEAMTAIDNTTAATSRARPPLNAPDGSRRRHPALRSCDHMPPPPPHFDPFRPAHQHHGRCRPTPPRQSSGHAAGSGRAPVPRAAAIGPVASAESAAALRGSSPSAGDLDMMTNTWPAQPDHVRPAESPSAPSPPLGTRRRGPSAGPRPMTAFSLVNCGLRVARGRTGGGRGCGPTRLRRAGRCRGPGQSRSGRRSGLGATRGAWRRMGGQWRLP